LGGLLDRLETKNYILRRKVPGDRRIKLVGMTTEGKELLRVMQERTADLNAEMMAGMTNDEIMRVDDILHRMKQRLQEMNHESKAIRREAQEQEESASFL
jgi:DNA-binding MarR family transcriptional regulator